VRTELAQIQQLSPAAAAALHDGIVLDLELPGACRLIHEACKLLAEPANFLGEIRHGGPGCVGYAPQLRGGNVLRGVLLQLTQLLLILGQLLLQALQILYQDLHGLLVLGAKILHVACEISHGLLALAEILDVAN
jgi:hypothetical protein